MGIVIEIVGRNGTVLRSQRFSDSTITVGRGYDCDLILTDVHVDPKHLKLVLDENTDGIRCEDLNTVNGTWLIEPSKFQGLHKNKRQIHRHSPVFSGQAIQLGKTFLRVYSSSHWVPETQALSAWEDVGHLLASYWLIGLMCCFVVTLEIWDVYLNTPNKQKVFEYILNGSYPLIAVITYALGWTMVGKNAKHDGKLFTHISVSLLTLTALGVVEMLIPPFVYATGLGGLQGILYKLLVVVIIFCSLSTTFIFATNLKRLSRYLLAALIPLAFLIPLTLSGLTKSDFNSNPEYDRSLARPIWSFREPVITDEFLDLAASLFPKETLKN